MRQQYEISYGVESDGNKTGKAADAKDGGNDANRVEMGVVGANYYTSTTANDTSSTVPSVTSKITLDSCVGLPANIASTSLAQGSAISIHGNCL